MRFNRFLCWRMHTIVRLSLWWLIYKSKKWNIFLNSWTDVKLQWLYLTLLMQSLCTHIYICSYISLSTWILQAMHTRDQFHNLVKSYLVYVKNCDSHNNKCWRVKVFITEMNYTFAWYNRDFTIYKTIGLLWSIECIYPCNRRIY